MQNQRPISFSVLTQGSTVMVIVYVFCVPLSAVTTTEIGGLGPPTRGILADGVPEGVPEPLMVNVAVESATVAVIVVFVVALGAVTV